MFFPDTWSASLFRKLPIDFRIVNAICESKVRLIYLIEEILFRSITFPNAKRLIWPLFLSPQVVFRSVSLPSYSPAVCRQRRRNGVRVLPRADRRDAALLGKSVWHLRYASVRKAWSGSSGGLDRILRLFGHPQRNLDVQNRPRLLQGHYRQAKRRQSGLQKDQVHEQPHRLRIIHNNARLD